MNSVSGPSFGRMADTGVMMSIHQIAVELGKLVSAAESTSAAADAPHFGAVLGDAGYALLRLKEQLTRDRSGRAASEFASRRSGGVDLLLRVLVNLQRLLSGHLPLKATSSTSSGVTTAGGSSLTSKRNAADVKNAASRRRKAAVAEADCLECIKLMVQTSHVSRMVLDYPTNLELIIMSLNSPQLDSKCYAIEVLLAMLDSVGGYSALNRSLNYIAGRNREESRLSIVVEQLKHGLHTNKLHIQVLVMRLLNKFNGTSSNINHRILAQIEAENAGLNVESLERIAIEFPHNEGADHLLKEVELWRQFYLPLEWLKRPPSSFAHSGQLTDETASSRQSSFGRPSRSTRSGAGGGATTVFVNQPISGYQTATTTSDDDGTIRSDRSLLRPSGRIFEGSPQYRQKYNINAPVVKNVQKTKRVTPTKRQTTSTPEQRRQAPRLGSAVSYPDFLPSRTRGRVSKSPRMHRSVDNLSSHRPTPRRSLPILETPTRSAMRRAKSETALSPSQLPPRNLKRPTAARSAMNVAPRVTNGGGGRLSRSGSTDTDQGTIHMGTNRRSPKVKGLSKSVHELRRVGEEGGQQQQPLRPLTPLQPITVQATQTPFGRHDAEYRIPDTQHRRQWRPRTPTDRTNEIIRNISPRVPSSGFKEEQSRSILIPNDHGDEGLIQPKKPAAVRMQGFSYLFPQQPITDRIPLKSPQSDSGYSRGRRQQQRPPSAPDFNRRRQTSPTFYAPPPPSVSPPISTMSDDRRRRRETTEAVYLPIRLQGTDEVVQRRQRYYQPPRSDGYPVPVGGGGTPSVRSAYSGSSRHGPIGGADGASTSSFYSTMDSRRSVSPLPPFPRHPRERRRAPTGSVYSYGDEDIKDALARFDYLNDYETASRA